MALAAPFFALGELDASNCDRVIEELPFVTNFVTGLIFVLLVTAVWLTVTSWRDKKILLMSGATTLMLAIFSASNIVGVFSQEYGVENYNLFGVPIFVAFLAYSTIYFKNLNANLIGTQTLIFSLLAFVIAGLFLPDSASIGLALGFKVVTVVFVGGLLMMSSRRETRLRERAEALSKNLEVANLRLLELDKQKTEFVSLASHQLRGPITAIKGYASMLNEGDYGALPVAAMEILGRVQKSAHDMAVLIGDYLDVTRIELGKVKFQPERFSMRDLLSEVEKELLPNTPKERVTLEIEEGADPRFVYADRNKVKQVVGNLIDNAVKYTPKGAVKVTLTRNGGYARMEVKDNGVGINKTSLPHLFQKFSRAQNASKSNIKGTGLGLYIAKTIADHHRGRLSAMSEGEGKGSTFIFELPLADEQAPSKKAA
jgi:signal transduction histidine kinase